MAKMVIAVYSLVLVTLVRAMDFGQPNRIQTLKDLCAGVVAASLPRQPLAQLTAMPGELQDTLKEKIRSQLLALVPPLPIGHKDMAPFTTHLEFNPPLHNLDYYRTKEFFFSVESMPDTITVQVLNAEGKKLHHLLIDGSNASKARTYQNWATFTLDRENQKLCFTHDLAHNQSQVVSIDEDQSILGIYKRESNPLLLLRKKYGLSVNALALESATVRHSWQRDSQVHEPIIQMHKNLLFDTATKHEITIRDPLTGDALKKFSLDDDTAIDFLLIQNNRLLFTCNSAGYSIHVIQGDTQTTYPNMMLYRCAKNYMSGTMWNQGQFSFPQGVLIDLCSAGLVDIEKFHWAFSGKNNLSLLLMKEYVNPPCKNLYDMDLGKIIMRFYSDKDLFGKAPAFIDWQDQQQICIFDLNAYLDSIKECSLEGLQSLLIFLKKNLPAPVKITSM